MAKSTPAQRFTRIFELFLNGATPGERDAAERKVNAWLKQHGKTRADIKAILAQAAADDAAQAPPPPPSDPRDAAPAQPIDPNVTVLDLIRERAELYLVFSSPHEYVAYVLRHDPARGRQASARVADIRPARAGVYRCVDAARHAAAAVDAALDHSFNAKASAQAAVCSRQHA